MSAVHSNKMTLQINDLVRLIFQDERGGIPPFEQPVICETVAVVVLTMVNARALRDMLVNHVKDDPETGTMQ